MKPITQLIDNYFERLYTRHQRCVDHDGKIANRAEELTNGEYNAYLPENVSEAMGEMEYRQPLKWAEYCTLLAKQDDIAANALLRDYIEEYWTNAAFDKAMSEEAEARIRAREEAAEDRYYR